MEQSIHNGQIYVDGKPQVEPEAPASPQAASELDPDAIAAAMAQVISQAFAEVPKPLPIEVVNRLLQLKSPKGQKLVWTRFDLFQCFALWSRKIVGETKA